MPDLNQPPILLSELAPNDPGNVGSWSNDRLRTPSVIVNAVDLSAAIATLQAEIARLTAMQAPVPTDAAARAPFPRQALRHQHQIIGLFVL